MILEVAVEMSDHPSVVHGVLFYPDFAVQIGDRIITSDSKLALIHINSFLFLDPCSAQLCSPLEAIIHQKIMTKAATKTWLKIVTLSHNP